MVSLENRVNYLSRIIESPKLAAFYNLLYDKLIFYNKKDEQNESGDIYYGLINAIQSNDKVAFDNYYNKKSKSHPSKDSPSPFMNDDFLIFSLIVGIIKYGYDRAWIKNIVSVRSQNPVSMTLDNILKEDFYSKSNLSEILLVFSQLCNPALITNNLLNTTYKSILNNITLFQSRNDFQIICAMRSYDLILELKEAPEGSKISLLQEFNLKFLKRAKYFTWIMQTIFLFLLLYGIVKVSSLVPAVAAFLSKYNPILSFIGISILSIFSNFLPAIKKKSYEIILRMLGYPKALAKEINKKY